MYSDISVVFTLHKHHTFSYIRHFQVEAPHIQSTKTRTINIAADTIEQFFAISILIGKGQYF